MLLINGKILPVNLRNFKSEFHGKEAMTNENSHPRNSAVVAQSKIVHDGEFQNAQAWKHR